MVLRCRRLVSIEAETITEVVLHGPIDMLQHSAQFVPFVSVALRKLKRELNRVAR